MQRYVLNAGRSDIQKAFGVASDSDAMYSPSFNVLPGSLAPVIYGKQHCAIKKGIWGLCHSREESVTVFNAEDVLEDAELMAEITKNPCIVPANGFYKWKNTVNDPLPFYIRRLSTPVMGIAGFFSLENNQDINSSLRFSILSVPANVLLKPLGTTMPCLLEPCEFSEWLGGHPENILQGKINNTRLIPDLAVYRVSEKVNDPSQNSEELIRPIPKLREED